MIGVNYHSTLLTGKFCPDGIISFIFMIKGKGLLNNGKNDWYLDLILNEIFVDTIISLLSYDTTDGSESSLDINLVLGADISTIISFDGQNLKEKSVSEDVVSYK